MVINKDMARFTLQACCQHNPGKAALLMYLDQIITHTIGFCFPIAALHVMDYTFKRMFALGKCHHGRWHIGTGCLHRPIHITAPRDAIFTQLLPRSIYIKTVMLG
jgi:hypothetical protein